MSVIALHICKAAAISVSAALGVVFALVFLRGSLAAEPGQIIVAGRTGALAAEAIDRDLADD